MVSYFICRLLNDAVNSCDYTAPNGRISDDLEMIRKEVVVAYFNVLRKTTNIPGQDSVPTEIRTGH
jgi:hypothetical protein